MAIVWSNPQAPGANYGDHIRISEAACTTGSEALPAYEGAYDPATIYAAGVFATYGGVLHLSLQAANQGNVPGPNSAWWTQAFGLDLKNLDSVGVAVELPAGAIGANASIQMYVVNPATGVPLRASQWDQPLTQGNAGELTTGFKVSGVGKLIGLPNNVGSACNVFLNGLPRPGILAS